jgi:biotin carboxyl carrier protein
MVPGKKMEINEGIRFLEGKGKIDIPLKKKEESKTIAASPAVAGSPAGGPFKTRCTVEERGKSRVFTVTVEPLGQAERSATSTTNASPRKTNGTPVFSTFAGKVDVVDILVKEGDTIHKGQVIAQVEAMKAKHDIKAQQEGIVNTVLVTIGDEIDSSQPILILE